MKKIFLAFVIVMATYMSGSAQQIGSFEWLMKSYESAMNAASHNDVYYCDNGSLLVHNKFVGTVWYMEKDMSYLFELVGCTNLGWNGYKAKYGTITLYPVFVNNPAREYMIATFNGSNQMLCYIKVPENQLDNYKRKCKVTGSDFAQVAAATAQLGYAINEGLNASGYNNNYDQYSSNTYDPNSGLYRKHCTLCNGDGQSVVCNYAANYGDGTTQVYCKKCRKVMQRHSHPQCPSCRGKGYYMLAR